MLDEELLREHAVPGAALGMLRDGTVTTAYAGVEDVATGEPVSAATRFAVGSLGKSVLATAFARLAAAGRLSLEDPVGVHVPELRGREWAERATLRDLLANRSRVPLLAATEFANDDRTLAEYAGTVAQGEATGAFWSYSNAGWSLLGRALETLCGTAYEDALRAELLAPLGLDATAFGAAVGHELTADGVVHSKPWTPRALAPAGSTLLATLDDMLRFARAHLEDPALGELRIVHADVRIHAWLDAWCLGWARFDGNGVDAWGWDGLISGQRSVLRLVPERNEAVVLLTNCGTGRALYRSLLDVPLALEPSTPVDGLERYAGTYAWPDRRVEVAADRDALVIDGRRALPLDERTFLVDASDPDVPTVTFDAFDDDGRPGVLYDMLWALPRQRRVATASV